MSKKEAKNQLQKAVQLEGTDKVITSFEQLFRNAYSTPNGVTIMYDGNYYNIKRVVSAEQKELEKQAREKTKEIANRILLEWEKMTPAERQKWLVESYRNDPFKDD